ncbi:hypothetical protein L1887_08973 [Cichorium endivia]|nr:hypothetical protein L1887_08973 [Cichorium endivia]
MDNPRLKKGLDRLTSSFNLIGDSIEKHGRSIRELHIYNLDEQSDRPISSNPTVLSPNSEVTGARTRVLLASVPDPLVLTRKHKKGREKDGSIYP